MRLEFEPKDLSQKGMSIDDLINALTSARNLLSEQYQSPGERVPRVRVDFSGRIKKISMD